MKEISLTIDGVEVKAAEGQSVLDAALDAGVYIPHICSHPDLSPQGECKLCVVETGGDTVLSCMTEASEGMVVNTKSDKLHHLRVTALELMLACHPHDCTSCVVYLNCELQAMMQYLSAAHSRMRDIKKKTINLNTNNPLIVREMERCIQCGRCVRACNELRGVKVLDYRNHDGESYVGTTDDLSLIESNCRFCGACIEVCPTGALRDADGIFKKDAPADIAKIPCRVGCPAHIDIPRYVRLAKEGRYSEATAVIREKAPFPISLGYVCNRLCESECKRNSLNDPVSIRDIKRFAAEHDFDEVWKEKHEKKPATGKKVAIVGGGPCGITAAYFLNRCGHDVTVFEKLPVAGGMLAYGIPEYRMPRDLIKKEVDTVVADGITLKTGAPVENAPALLKDGFDSVLVAVGASAGRKIGIPGSDLPYVYTALDVLRETALGNKVELGNSVAVLGGGNVAFDIARVCRRLGIEDVNMVCLEADGKMLADEEEIVQGREEGVKIHNSRTMIAIEEKDGRPSGIRSAGVNSFHFDAERKLVMDIAPDSESVIPADTIIFATGQKTDIDESFGLELTPFGFIDVKPGKYETSVEGVFAAGDVVSGTKFVIEGIARGKDAASAIDIYLGGDGAVGEVLLEQEPAEDNIGQIEGFALEMRKHTDLAPAEARVGSFARVDLGFSSCNATEESARCLQCDLRMKIAKPRIWTEFIKK